MMKNKLALIAIPSILVLGLTACNNGDIAEPDPSGLTFVGDWDGYRPAH